MKPTPPAAHPVLQALVERVRAIPRPRPSMSIALERTFATLLSQPGAADLGTIALPDGAAGNHHRLWLDIAEKAVKAVGDHALMDLSVLDGDPNGVLDDIADTLVESIDIALGWPDTPVGKVLELIDGLVVELLVDAALRGAVRGLRRGLENAQYLDDDSDNPSPPAEGDGIDDGIDDGAVLIPHDPFLPGPTVDHMAVALRNLELKLGRRRGRLRAGRLNR